ncbi:hypothetical protein F383_30699 [Gossypium arboreum]|uniref:Uncharacterized protein n=1 Tax=Gossypium arboreum TaxID=29729 RepID=A0A0B0MZN0_GOSAR|nr:hypothetical protein F383_30699 [Gossypium arboreum]
MRTLIISNLS